MNAQEYIDTLMSQINEYQHDSLITVLGDFNARIADNDDFIAGVDKLPSRDIIDYQTNQYCNMCLLNGRNFKSNGYTCISARGSSVVDYCLVPYENLQRYYDFEVIRARDILNRVINIETLDSAIVPDHSLLTWKLEVNYLHEKPTVHGYRGLLFHQIRYLEYT